MLEERSWFGRRPAPRQGGATGGGKQAIRRRRAKRQEQGARRRVERQFAVPFEGIEQIGQSRHEPFTANPARDHPELDERALDGRGVRLLSGALDRARARTGWMVEK